MILAINNMEYKNNNILTVFPGRGIGQAFRDTDWRSGERIIDTNLTISYKEIKIDIAREIAGEKEF
jgi:hypothetical protein